MEKYRARDHPGVDRVFVYDFFAFCKEVWFPCRTKHFRIDVQRLSAES